MTKRTGFFYGMRGTKPVTVSAAIFCFYCPFIKISLFFSLSIFPAFFILFLYFLLFWLLLDTLNRLSSSVNSTELPMFSPVHAHTWRSLPQDFFFFLSFFHRVKTRPDAKQLRKSHFLGLEFGFFYGFFYTGKRYIFRPWSMSGGENHNFFCPHDTFRTHLSLNMPFSPKILRTPRPISFVFGAPGGVDIDRSLTQGLCTHTP